MAVEVGAAYVRLLPTMRGFGAQTQRALQGQMAKPGRVAGQTLGAGMVAGTTSRLSGLGRQIGAISATIGLYQVGRAALESAKGLEQSEAALKGLYGSGQQASDVMARLRQVSSDSPIPTSAWVGGAEALAYLGVEGDRSVGILQQIETAMVAAGKSGVEMDRVTEAMLSMANQGKATASEVNRMSQAGLPAWEMLADHMGTSIEGARDRVTQGLVDIDDVLGAVEAGGGDTFARMEQAASESADTFAAQWERAKDNVIVGLGDMIQPLLTQLTPAVRAFGDVAGDVFASIPDMMANVRKALVDSGIAAALGSLFSGIKDIIVGLWPAVQGFGTVLGAVFGGLLLALKPIGDLLGWVGRWMQEHTMVVQVLGAAVAGAVTGFMAFRAVTGVINMVRLAQLGLNAAMRANPLMLVVTAIGALVAALIYAYQNSETFREIVNTAFHAIADVAMWLWESVMQPVWAGITEAWNAAATVVSWLGERVDAAFAAIAGFAQGLWAGIKTVFSAIASWIQARIGDVVAVATRIRGFVDNVLGFFGNLRDGIATRITNVVDAVRRIPDRIRQVFGNAGRWLVNAGSNIVNGLRDGMVRQVNRLVDWFRQQMQRIRNMLPFSPAKDGPFSGSGSPDIAGGKIVSMVADGIRRQGTVVSSAMSTVLDSVDTDLAVAPTLGGVSALAGVGGSRSGMAPATTVTIDGQGLDRALLVWLRQAVRVEGGGDVQSALGQGRGGRR